MINVAGYDNARPFRRKSKGTYVAALHELDETPDSLEDGLAASYPMLVRALANIVLALTPGPAVRFTTMERGNYVVEAPNNAELADRVVERLKPLALSRLVIDNEFRPDLEPELWDGDEFTAELSEVGARLGTLDLLPSPFPIEDLLNERDLRHVKRLYGVGGLSYGNLSIRKDERRFWMSASGVDKSKLEQPGRDILLVSDYDEVNGRMVLSVPPGVEPRRVSVDAIEHWMIYQAHPDVGAILHLHAWVEGIRGTEINYPVRHRGARRERRRADRPGARPRPRDRRPAQPRHHRDRREPRRDARPDHAAPVAPGPDGLSSLGAHPRGGAAGRRLDLPRPPADGRGARRRRVRRRRRPRHARRPHPPRPRLAGRRAG